jgi:DNA-directed RNA polymerase specialized sigma24 family protein
MSREVSLTKEAFDRLLTWLGPNRDDAGKKYEAIRERLIKIFTCRGCNEAEEMADDTFNRVTLKIEELSKNYVGDPALYFYGVAQKVFLESLRKRPSALPPPAPPNSEEIEQEYQCLERCLEQLPLIDRQLVLEYYQNDKREKIDRRKEMARRMGIAQNALRIRTHRIRLILQGCVQKCLEQRLPA